MKLLQKIKNAINTISLDEPLHSLAKSRIYYSHHGYAYNTEIEEYELALIRSYYPNAYIFNPSKDLLTNVLKTEQNIMKARTNEIANSDIVIFSSMDGVIGSDVYNEVYTSAALAKPTYYIYQDRLHTYFTVNMNTKAGATDDIYAFVNLEEE